MSTTASKIVKLKSLASKSSLSLSSKTPQSLLLRDFIHDRLYGVPGGYFTKDEHQVGRLREPIKFSKLRGYFDYRQEMERLYPENQWVTPCELFKPYYGYTIANYILNQLEDRKQKRLRVVEIGPGTGTMADSLLDFFKNYNLDMYRECEYVFIEISPQLAAECEKLMMTKHRELWDKNRIKIFNGSILDFEQKVSNLCFVIALEVLDNMPHDRMYFTDNKITHQAMINIDYDDKGAEVLSEEKVQINDELSKLFVDLYSSMPSKDHISANKILKQEGFFKRLTDMINIMKYKEDMVNNIFAPTAALKMITHISKQIPDHCLIMADFDSFIMPKNSIRGINAPLVTNKLKDPTQWKTYDHYLIPRGDADICFPVDFNFLKHAYQKISGLPANVYKTSEFADLFALQSWCTTQNMYNPMKEEYFNTSFIVTDRSGNTIGFNPVRESKENLFASNLMPLPPKFAFQERTGRINWRSLMNTDLDKISKEVDLKGLETLLQNITFAQLDRDDLERLGDAHFIKLFRLSQYSIEYLLYTQAYLESLCKTLDIEYKQTYEKTVKTEEIVKKYQQELKIMRKELKLKQKTLSTYEYLMKLPAEQEQDVIKCKHCSKFFLSKSYLQKHYQRHHPEIDFYREFSDLPPGKYDTINDRSLQQTQPQKPQINQEELFEKIKTELFVSLTQNFKRLEEDLSTLKEKQNYRQIQDLLQNYEHKNEEEQKKIQEQLQRPAKMLEELKGKWSEMFSQQSTTMKDMIQQSVGEALNKRKEEREKKKQMVNNRSGDLNSEQAAIQEQKVKYFESRIKELEENFQQNEKNKNALELKVKEYEKHLQEKNQAEQILAQRLLEEEQKRKEEERLRKEKEQELLNSLDQKAKVEMALKLKEEQRIRDEQEKKLRDEQEQIRLNEENKRKQLLDEEDKLRKLQEQKELELKQKQEEEQKQKLLKDEEEKQKKLLEDKKQQELELKKKQDQDAAAAAEQEKLRKLKEEEEKQKKQKELEEAKKKQQEEEENQEEIVIEEDVEEEIDDIEEEQAKQKIEQQKKDQEKQQKQIAQAEVNPSLSKRERVKKQINLELLKDNIYEGNNAQIKSIFSHNQQEIDKNINDIKIQSISIQENLLQQEFKSQKIQPLNEKSNPISTSRKEELRNVNDAIRGLSKRDVEKINNSLQKRLSDQTYQNYSERPNSSIALNNNGQADNLQQKPILKKVKILCQSGASNNVGNGVSSPQPLLASSNSQKNINMVKALQQINHLISSGHQYSQNATQLSQITVQTAPIQQNLNMMNGSSGGNVAMKTAHSTKNLSQSNQQHQFTLIKSPKQTQQQMQMPSSLLNIPLYSKSNLQTQQKLKQLSQKASGLFMQKCESHATLLINNATGSKSTKNLNPIKDFDANKENHHSLSPQSDKHKGQGSNSRGQQSSKQHSRQKTIMSFNQNAVNMILQSDFKQNNSISPNNQKQNSHSKQSQAQAYKQNTDRVRSLENYSLEIISKATNQGSQEFKSIEQEKRKTQIIRISPHKQFIVQPSTAQHTSPKEFTKKNGFKLQLRNHPKPSNNLILEQEDYLLPNCSNDEDGNHLDYSLTKDYQKFINHDHNMTKQSPFQQNNHQGKRNDLESEGSMNKGFMTDRQQQSSNIDLQRQSQDSKQEMNSKTTKRKTKGISYTRNAQELKKLLLETGVIGGITSSLATAAGMISSTQDTIANLKDVTTCKTGVHKSTIAKVKNTEVFCFSARNKGNKEVIVKPPTTQQQQSTKQQNCLLESKIINKKQNSHHRILSNLETSIQTTQPTHNNGLYQTHDQQCSQQSFYPQSTTNNHNLKEFILKDDDEINANINNAPYDDQVVFKSKRQSSASSSQINLINNPLPTRRSPSSYVSQKGDEQSQMNINFPFTETEQFILKNDRTKNKLHNYGHYHSGSVIDSNSQRVLARCWTAQDNISSMDRYINRQLETQQVASFDEECDQDLESRVETGSQPQTMPTMTLSKQQIIKVQKRMSGASGITGKVTNITHQEESHRVKSVVYGSMINDDNLKSTQTKQIEYVDIKELEILKFKMIAFVKTYESEFRKMKMQMNELKHENAQLKKKVHGMSKRRLSAAMTNQTSQISNYVAVKGGTGQNNPNCLKSAHNSHLLM